LLTVEGELDDISGSGQTKAALKLCAGIPTQHKKHYEAIGAGHYGIFSGRRWRDFVYPEVRQFIMDHHVTPSTAKAPARRVNQAKSVVAPKRRKTPATQ
jgi:poly(3-hydroxybutyrate) depolymerase